MTKLPLFLALGGLVTTACSWGKFDDLRDEAWVRAVENPDDDSTNWAIAIQRGNRDSASGGRLAVFGSAQSLFNEILYDPNGGAEVATNQQKLQSLGIGNLDPQPIVIADPASDEIALVSKSGSASIAVLHGVNGTLIADPIFGPDIPDAAVYMVAPGFGTVASPQPSQPIVAQGDTVYGTFYTKPDTSFQQPACKLAIGATPISIKALGTHRATAADTDDVVVWAATGELLIYDGDIFNGMHGTVCASGTANAPLATLATGFQPGNGSQILALDNRYVVLQGHNGGNAHLALYDLEAGPNPAIVGGPRTDSGMVIATLLDTGGSKLVAVGFPAAQVDGTACGQVQAFAVDTTSGIGTTPVLILHDAQPDQDQSFGRGVATMRFNGRDILVVAANNEVFAYFRTSAYADARTGR